MSRVFARTTGRRTPISHCDGESASSSASSQPGKPEAGELGGLARFDKAEAPVIRGESLRATLSSRRIWLFSHRKVRAWPMRSARSGHGGDLLPLAAGVWRAEERPGE